jgi:hypothetical protein
MKLKRAEIEKQKALLRIRQTLEGICQLQKVKLEDVFHSDIEVYELEVEGGTNFIWNTHMNEDRPTWATDDNRVSYDIQCAINVKRNE